MQDQPTQEQIDQWHRWFAIRCNNDSWDLASKPDRTPVEDRDMLYLAYASAFHWSKIGKPINDARAELALAHMHALLGHAELSLKYAQHCLDFFENNDCEDWDLAFAHAEIAQAAALLGDVSLHTKHYKEAQRRGNAIQGEVDRRIFLEEFARIPAQVRSIR